MTKTERMKLEAEMAKRWSEDPESTEFKAKQALYGMLRGGRAASIGAMTQLVMAQSLGRDNVDIFEEIDYWQQILDEDFVPSVAAMGITYMMERGKDDKLEEMMK